ncbi:BID domain-containing T4SS effector [Bartonella ancashensis]|uniref:Uncharacterized protein n=1 Tax=Bartonella ancashensis TaxID=1318743 RepID=A0A0M3T2L0_9HYPH|nr:BID domain-containing T4SS effector [Bartonella ancashensis]ALE03031.1 hypothetical protein PU02_0217 [Bartonella ancashensis]ARE31034.1 Bep217 [Bartonella ancashensis]
MKRSEVKTLKKEEASGETLGARDAQSAFDRDLVAGEHGEQAHSLQTADGTLQYTGTRGPSGPAGETLSQGEPNLGVESLPSSEAEESFSLNPFFSDDESTGEFQGSRQDFSSSNFGEGGISSAVETTHFQSVQMRGIAEESKAVRKSLKYTRSVEASFDVVSFSSDRSIERLQQPRDILIPSTEQTTLSESEIARRVADDDHIKASYEQIERLSKIVYGNEAVLQREISRTGGDPTLIHRLSEDVKNNPASISRLAGSQFTRLADATRLPSLVMKTMGRTEAEEHVPFLSFILRNHAKIVEFTRDRIVAEHRDMQKRRENPVEAPSKELSRLFLFSKGQQIGVLSELPELRDAVCCYAAVLNAALSKDEQKAIQDNDIRKLAESLNLSFERAGKIAETFNLVKDIQESAQQIEINAARGAVVEFRKQHSSRAVMPSF